MTLPFHFAFTGPILVTATAWNEVSEVFSSDSQPGIVALSTSGSLSFSHTVWRGAASWTSPVMVMAIDSISVSINA